MKKILNEHRNILESFLASKIPEMIKWEDADNYDLMECYEILFNYSHTLLDNKDINNFETKKEFVFEQKYKDILYDLSKKNDNNLKIHCYLSLATITILEIYRNI